VIGTCFAKSPADLPFEEDLFPEPYRHGCDKGPDPARGEGVIGFKQPLEFKQGLVIKNNSVEIIDRAARKIQAERDGIDGERSIMLFAGKAFFLGCGKDPAVLDNGGSRVVIKCGNTKDAAHRYKLIFMTMIGSPPDAAAGLFIEEQVVGAQHGSL